MDHTAAKAEGSGLLEGTSDYANYFCTYSYLYHQKQMLTDTERMNRYRDAIIGNSECFRDRVVLDVGTGSGILAIWAAQAGASKVYAIEATSMATHARALVKANKLEEVIEVFQQKVEDVCLPQKVDIIISEWMGYFLLRESMLDSVLVARDRWLKPGGALYPSHATISLAPVADEQTHSKKSSDYYHSMDDWTDFVSEMQDAYKVDMEALTPSFRKEQESFFLRTGIWVELSHNQVLSDECVIASYDLSTCTLKDVESLRASFSFAMGRTTRLTAFAGWFDVYFRGSDENPAKSSVRLSTAPRVGYTHWGQQLFLVENPIQVCVGDTIEGEIEVRRSKDNHRLLDVSLSHALREAAPSDLNSTARIRHPTSEIYHIE